LKCIKFNFCWSSTLDSAGGAYSTPPGSLAVFKGSTSKGSSRGGKRRRKDWKGERRFTAT